MLVELRCDEPELKAERKIERQRKTTFIKHTNIHNAEFGISVLYSCSSCDQVTIVMDCLRTNAPINVNPVGGGGVRARGGDLMPETIPLSGF